MRVELRLLGLSSDCVASFAIRRRRESGSFLARHVSTCDTFVELGGLRLSSLFSLSTVVRRQARAASMPTIRNVSRRLYRFGRTLWGGDFVAEPEIACRRVRLGSEYGGWWVRPDWITSDSVVMSVGVGPDVTFDLEMVERFGCTVHAFDSTPKSVDWVRAQRCRASSSSTS